MTAVAAAAAAAAGTAGAGFCLPNTMTLSESPNQRTASCMRNCKVEVNTREGVSDKDTSVFSIFSAAKLAEANAFFTSAVKPAKCFVIAVPNFGSSRSRFTFLGFSFAFGLISFSISIWEDEEALPEISDQGCGARCGALGFWIMGL